MTTKTSITDNSNIKLTKVSTLELLELKQNSIKNKSFPLCDKAVTEFNHAVVKYFDFQYTAKILKETTKHIEIQWGKTSLLFPLKTLKNGNNQIVSFFNV